MDRRIVILLELIVILNYVNAAPKSSNAAKKTRSKKVQLKYNSDIKNNSLLQFVKSSQELTESELSGDYEKPNLEEHADGNNDNESNDVYSEEEVVGSTDINYESENTTEKSLDKKGIKKLNDDNSNGNYNSDEGIVEDDEEEDENSEYTEDDADKPKLQLLGLGNDIRSLMSGDTFTPSEMLPITKKLISKVEKPGKGKGIVSSAMSPQQLADRLFEAFFYTPKRIVTLKDFDISGLDALQALALSGEPAIVRTAAQSVTEPPRHHILNLRGQYVDIDTSPRMCHYRLVTKKVNIGRHKLKKTKRRVIALAKKLAKKRRLVIKDNLRDKVKTNRQRTRESRGKSKQRVNYGSKKRVVNLKRKVIRRNKNKPTAISGEDTEHLKSGKGHTTKPKSTCNWHYECRDPSNLDTCRLHTKCRDDKIKTPQEDITIQHNEDEHNIELKNFRKMLGISIIDEEVEKILESRIINLKPSNMNGADKIETLTEYFNRIIMVQHFKSTTPKAAVIVELSTEKWTDDLPRELSDKEQSDDEKIKINLANKLTTSVAKNTMEN